MLKQHHGLTVQRDGYVPKPLTAVMIHPRVSLSIPVVSIVADIGSGGRLPDYGVAPGVCSGPRKLF